MGDRKDANSAPPVDRRLEQLKLEHALAVEEYKTIKNSIAQHIAFSHQAFALTLTLAGLTMAGLPFVVSHKVVSLLVAASWVFLTVAWVQLRVGLVVIAMHDHLVSVVEPALDKITRAVCPGVEVLPVGDYSWEQRSPSAAYGPLWLTWPILLGRYCVPMTAASLSFAAYLRFGHVPFQLSLQPVGMLCILQVALFAYTIAMIVWVGRIATRVHK